MKNILQTSIKSLNTAALAAAVFASIPSHAADQPISPADQAYFEGKIRPILIKYCYNCHGNGATKGSLDLSSKAGTLFAGSNGAAVVPGYPGKSLMIKRLKDLNDPMPPAGKDAPTQVEIAELKNWISQGAPDPRSGMKPIMDRERAKNHPFFQKVKPPIIPSPQVVMNGKLKNWCKNPIDSYVLKKLEKQNMVPSRRAEKWSLLRRVYFDLIGLPPSFDDVQRFVNGFESYEQVVDRLLASPQYGERWGRHWLDVARYADTTGNNNRRGRPSRYIHAYTYRDWVINALNADMPYDQFLINQIAADRKQESPVNLPALGFLTLGPRVAGDVEIIDDRIDVITRGTMGLSVYCARCHDHKFDPIPTADYYSLVGVLKNSRELSEEEKSTLIQNSQKGTGAGGSIFYISTDPDYAKYTAEKEKLENNYKQFRLLEEYKVNSNSRAHAAAYMYWTDSFAKQKKRVERNRRAFERILDENEKKRTGKKDAKSKIKLRADVGEAWQRYLSRKSEQDRVFGPWKIYSNVSTDHLGRWYPKDQKKLQEAHRKVASMIPNAGAKAGEMGKQFNPYVADLFRTPPASMSDVAGRYHSLFELAKKQWLYVDGVSYIMRKQAKARGEKMDPPGNMEDAQNRFGVEFDEQFGKDYAKNMDEIRRVLFDQGHPGKFSFDTIKRVNGTLRQQEREWFISKLTSLKRSIAPKLPPILTDKPNPRDEAIRIKGERNRPGKVVPRQFPEILAGPDRQPFKVGSGRLELAQAIASKDNPLTARVMVNRIWMHHFGKGIVASINEFGLRATDPSHPELLDYLAWYFTGNNWSMKALHKHILMSNTYQQTSQDNPRYSVMDPENINYYKMDRRRLDLESFRDGLIQVSGVLDLTMGGRPVRLPNYRRTVYGLVDRRNLDEMFKTFDFPNPNSTAGQRFISTVSQQALFMMNSPMLADLAHQIVLRKEFRDIQNDRSRIASLYNMIYQRDPKPIELKLGQRYLQKQIGGVPNGAMRVQTWDNGYGQWGVVDAKNKFYSVTFRPFPFTDGKVWKGNTPAFGPLKLTATGGHPGTQSNVAVIRRWVAPRDTTVNISGRLEHQLDDAAKAIYDKQFNAGHRKWYDENAWNGVTGIVVVSSAGQRVGKEIWRSDVRRGRRDVNVSDIKIRRGGTIDFIITCNKNINPKTLNAIATTFKLTNPQQDNFTWNPTVSIKKEIAEAMKEKASSLLITSWTASEEFQGATYKPKPLNAWEKYVQVLLLSNELAYVD